MNKLTKNFLKVLRYLYLKYFKNQKFEGLAFDNNPDSVALTITEALLSPYPVMIARFGSTEMSCLLNYMSVKNTKSTRFLEYVKGKSYPFWWEKKIINQMQQWSGFFPATEAKIEEFCELMLLDIKEVDILGSWLPDENKFNDELSGAKKVRFIFLDPFWSKNPWTSALKGKKVLVVHPFSETIERQYKNRELLFNNNLLPEFELKTIKAVQTIAGNKSDFDDWFGALNYMKDEIAKVDFDICLIGCGAYGFPIAAHVKRLGKKGFHLGGSLQLLFGIRGKRWEETGYSTFNYPGLVNEYWVKPGENEKPPGASTVESACYW